MSEKILIGTSGWGYDEWLGTFYPKHLKKHDYLMYYTQVYYTNEINTTFYNIPSKNIVENWANNTPDDFLFTAKLPKAVTHDSKLDFNYCIEDLYRFLNNMNPLIQKGKLLALLVQLPPSFTKEKHFTNLKEFFENWPTRLENQSYHIAVEFRHKSWMNDSVFEYLRKISLVYCGVIEPTLPSRMDITNPKFSYIRFHGFGSKIWFDYDFTQDEISKYAKLLNEVIPNVEKIGIYFNNHFSGYAAKNSLMMMKELNVSPRNDPNEFSFHDINKKTGKLNKSQIKLDKYFG